MYKPVSYYVLIQMKEVENTSEGGIILGSNAEMKREQEGQDVGVIKAFGPGCFKGFDGIDDDADIEERARLYGVSIGDTVEYTRYDGKRVRHPDYSEDHRIIQDVHIVGVHA